MTKAVAKSWAIRMRDGSYFQSLHELQGVDLGCARRFASKQEAEAFLDSHVAWFASGGCVAVAVTKIDPLSIACPSCGAEIGVRCWSGTRRGRHLTRGHHPDRRRVAAGEHVPENFGAFLRRELRRVEGEVVDRHKRSKA